MSIADKIAEYREDFDLFETTNEKFEYLLDLAKKHMPLPKSDKNDRTYINGCSSDAWLVVDCDDGIVRLRGEGTSEIAKGMLVLLLDIFDSKKPDEILGFDPARLSELGIVDLLSPVRRQSLEAFMTKLYAYVRDC